MAETKKTTTPKKKTIVKKQLKEVETTPVTTKKPEIAKAGKRSEKALKEVELKEAKEVRKQEKAVEVLDQLAKPKVQQNKPKSQLERKGKKYRKLAEQIDRSKLYSLLDAIDLASKTSPTKFDATVELHVRLGVDPRQSDQNIRDTVILPSGTGKKVRIAVLAENDDVDVAKNAGADIAESDDLLQQLEKGVIDFDILIATPSMMAKLGKYARLLGPKGLMPNPKSGTVTTDITKAVTEAKAGRVEYRVDSTGIVHIGIGKVSFGTTKLIDNLKAAIASIKNNKPASIKGSYVQSVYITTSQGPSIPVDVNETN